MTKEELEKATGQELIDERNYCGVDGYYGVYLDNVNTEILKRLNRLAELEKENTKLKGLVNQYKASKCSSISFVNRNMIMFDQLTKAKELLKRYVPYRQITDSKAYKDLAEETEQFLNEVEK